MRCVRLKVDIGRLGSLSRSSLAASMKARVYEFGPGAAVVSSKWQALSSSNFFSSCLLDFTRLLA